MHYFHGYGNMTWLKNKVLLGLFSEHEFAVSNLLAWVESLLDLCVNSGIGPMLMMLAWENCF
jgi:hypothetical protein